MIQKDRKVTQDEYDTQNYPGCKTDVRKAPDIAKRYYWKTINADRDIE